MINDIKYYGILFYFNTTLQKIFYASSEKDFTLWMMHLKKATNFIDLNDYYDIGEDIGEGRFGVVKMGFSKEKKQKVAIKILDKKEMTSNDLSMVRTEIEILKICQHPNIVQLYDKFENSLFIYISKYLMK